MESKGIQFNQDGVHGINNNFMDSVDFNKVNMNFMESWNHLDKFRIVKNVDGI